MQGFEYDAPRAGAPQPSDPVRCHCHSLHVLPRNTALEILFTVPTAHLSSRSPPPKGSSLYQRLIVLGRGAMAYGKFSVARECFEAAGARHPLSPATTSKGCWPLAQTTRADARPRKTFTRPSTCCQRLALFRGGVEPRCIAM